MSDRIAVLNLGLIEQIGSPREIYEQPKNKFVADFIGGDANILRGRVEQFEGSFALVSIGDRLKCKASNPNFKQIGTEVDIVIRPERVKMLTNDFKVDNCYMGHVRQASYVGEIIRYLVGIDDVESMVLKEHNRGQKIKTPGEKIKFGWNCQDALVV